jgi:hypothetical protein
MTFPAANKTNAQLVAAGIARELTGQRRNRVFSYDAYLSSNSPCRRTPIPSPPNTSYKQTEIGVIPEEWEVNGGEWSKQGQSPSFANLVRASRMKTDP